jgi:SpoVK/Ycf46/Vps4 family AAA+-type ATPase
MAATKPAFHPEVSLFRRNAARLTTRSLLHESEKQEQIAAAPRFRRNQVRAELEAAWRAEETAALEDARPVIELLRGSITELDEALELLATQRLPELLGKVEAEQLRVRTAGNQLHAADEALAHFDFGTAGAAVEEAERELWMVGGQLIVALNRALSQAAVGKEFRAGLEENLAERRQAKLVLEHARPSGGRDLLEAAARVRHLEAAGFRLAAEILANQVRADGGSRSTTAKVGRDNELRVVSPHECETFADVGGLEEVKAQLRETIGTILERPDEAARYHVVHNGILFFGPPGTGKNLLSRALAGEYGLRYIRFSPATIASAYIHEAAANLRRLFELARQNTPCVLYLDEIDTIASDRGDQPSADHREVVTQLMVCLEEYRTTPGLIITAGTNDLDRLDPALREGRFDAKILVPLPDPDDRMNVFEVHLRRRGDAVDWKSVKLLELAKLTNGYNAAAIETVVSLASQAALKKSVPINQSILAHVIRERGGQHRISLDERVTWDDVVLTDETREHVLEILTVFSRPDLADQVGIRPPAGILLYGPPGTGKTTIAKAMATEVSASFYEMSAADLLSKWAGESEQRVAKLFTKARANRPSVIFIDEIDALLRRRSADSANKWEERVLSQFLRELDGLRGGEGVLLVGATNRLDTIDEAIVGRRLTPIEVGLPDPETRLRLLQLLCRDVKVAKGLNLRELVPATEGMSGADLKRVRDAAGMKALTRVARGNGSGTTRRSSSVTVTMADFEGALGAARAQSSLAQV